MIQRTSRDKSPDTQRQKFKNSSSLMHFYHNGTFNYKQVQPYNPEKYRDCASTTERSSSYSALKKRRFNRQNNLKQMLGQSPQSHRTSSIKQSLKGDALNNYIGYLESIVKRLKEVQKKESEDKLITTPKKKQSIQATQVKKRPSFFPMQIQTISHQKSTSKKQLLNTIIDESKRKNQIIKLQNVRNRYKSLCKNDSSEFNKKSNMFGQSQNVSSIQEKKVQRSQSFVSQILNEFRISSPHKTDKKQNNILDLIDLDSRQIRNLSKRDNLKKQIIVKWADHFPKGFFDCI